MLNNQKHLFQLREGIHYLNCAYKAPLLRSSEEAAVNALIRLRNPADLVPSDFFKEGEEAKKLFAQLIHCKPSEVAFIPATSYGLASVLKNIQAPKTKKNVLVLKDEFPSDYFAVQRWCEENNCYLKSVV